MAVEIKTDRLNQADVAAAWAAVRAVCPKLTDHMADIVKVEAKAGRVLADYRAEKGWSDEVYIHARLSEKAPTFRGEDRAWGGVAAFVVGDGREPGVFVRHRLAQVACDLPLSPTGGDVFIATPVNFSGH